MKLIKMLVAQAYNVPLDWKKYFCNIIIILVHCSFEHAKLLKTAFTFLETNVIGGMKELLPWPYGSTYRY